MNTYLIYDKDGYIIDDIEADTHDDMLTELKDRMLRGELLVFDVQDAVVHMVLEIDLNHLVSEAEDEIIAQFDDEMSCEDCGESISPEALLTQEIEDLIVAHKEELGIKKVTIIVDCSDET